jgi:biotin carboxyl carrier protein
MDITLFEHVKEKDVVILSRQLATLFGAQVSAGQTVMIIEAMKTMNQIPAPKSGTVKRILIADGSPVEYGAPLMIIE